MEWDFRESEFVNDLHELLADPVGIERPTIGATVYEVEFLELTGTIRDRAVGLPVLPADPHRQFEVLRPQSTKQFNRGRVQPNYPT
jgi:hypothetical protein